MGVAQLFYFTNFFVRQTVKKQALAAGIKVFGPQNFFGSTFMISPKTKLWRFLALITNNLPYLHGKKGFGGSGGPFRAYFRTFLAPFFNRWSDKKVQKIKKFGKGHISIPRTKGFDVAF